MGFDQTLGVVLFRRAFYQDQISDDSLSVEKVRDWLYNLRTR